MIIENCDLCQIMYIILMTNVRFIPNELIDKKIVCIDCIEDNKKKEQKMTNKYDKLVFLYALLVALLLQGFRTAPLGTDGTIFK